MLKIERAVVAVLFNCLPSIVCAADTPAGILQCDVPASLRDPAPLVECWFSPNGGAPAELYTARLIADTSAIAPASGPDRARSVMIWTVYRPDRAPSSAIGALSGGYRPTATGSGLQGAVLRLEAVQYLPASQRVNLAAAVSVLVLQPLLPPPPPPPPPPEEQQDLRQGVKAEPATPKRENILRSETNKDNPAPPAPGK
jgi:hypothetical protein